MGNLDVYFHKVLLPLIGLWWPYLWLESLFQLGMPLAPLWLWWFVFSDTVLIGVFLMITPVLLPLVWVGLGAYCVYEHYPLINQKYRWSCLMECLVQKPLRVFGIIYLGMMGGIGLVYILIWMKYFVFG